MILQTILLVVIVADIVLDISVLFSCRMENALLKAQNDILKEFIAEKWTEVQDEDY